MTTMAQKFTPWPWYADASGNIRSAAARDAIHGAADYVARMVAPCNAPLLAASPELLAELEDAIMRMTNILTDKQLDAVFKDGRTIREKLGDYRAAITKTET